MNAVTPIQDTVGYNDKMAKSLIDKIYFLDKVDADVFVDFGCADGRMLSFIEKVFPGVTLIGYDNDPEMIELAKLASMNSGILFTSDWSEVVKAVESHKAAGRRTCLVLSSIIHEAYSYLSSAELDAMWNRVWGNDGVRFDAVAIRDMMVSRTTSRPSDPIAVARVRQVFDLDKLGEWESNWGSIDENWSLTHFLLTYQYTANWDREVKENYLPTAYEDFLRSIPRHYIPTFKEHFTLPYLRRQVRKDFGIELADRTHIKLILELTGAN